MSQFALPPGIDPPKVRLILIGEAVPEDMDDYFYGSGMSLYVTNTLAAFNSAGVEAKSIGDLTARGVYLTVAVKAPREGLIVPTEVIRAHSFGLEKELELFSNLRAMLLMGDAAIKALNFIALRNGGKRVIPTGATYKIRAGTYAYKGVRVFPSYLQTGKNFLIEKAKQKMVVEDIGSAFGLLT